jgi:hypothetical protein
MKSIMLLLLTAVTVSALAQSNLPAKFATDGNYKMFLSHKRSDAHITKSVSISLADPVAYSCLSVGYQERIGKAMLDAGGAVAPVNSTKLGRNALQNTLGIISPSEIIQATLKYKFSLGIYRVSTLARFTGVLIGLGARFDKFGMQYNYGSFGNIKSAINTITRISIVPTVGVRAQLVDNTGLDVRFGVGPMHSTTYKSVATDPYNSSSRWGAHFLTDVRFYFTF